MHTTWRLLIDQPDEGAANMARDQALAEAHASGATPPTLRLYRWRPACLSLGCFQRSAEIDRAACERAGIAIVRRPSGGRALLHDHELTYAVITRCDDPQLGGDSVLASYRQISMALVAGLQTLNVAAKLAPHARERRSGRSAACFDTPASYEITAGGRKLAGGAQTRRGGVLLQHGAFPLAPHADRLAGLLHQPPANLAASMITLDQAAGHAVSFDKLAQALIGGFVQAWGIRLEPGELTAAERTAERRLQTEKYSNDRWTFGR